MNQTELFAVFLKFIYNSSKTAEFNIYNLMKLAEINEICSELNVPYSVYVKNPIILSHEDNPPLRVFTIASPGFV